MKHKWFSKKSKFYPLMILIALTAVQFLYAQWGLQSYREYSKQDNETLYERMSRDNVPSDIKQHILYIQSQTTSNTSRLIRSLTSDQIFFQFGILFAFYFFLAGDRKTEDDIESKQ